MKPLVVLGLIGVALSCRAETPAAYDNEVPIAPIAATVSFGATNSFLIHNAWISATVFPDAGRIGVIQFDKHENMLRFDAPLLTAAPSEDWKNYGGDWLWPVAQSHWKQMQANDWPPPPLFRNVPWRAQTWESGSGAKYCLLGLELGEPLNVRIRRLVRVDPHGAKIDVRQRIERTAPSEIPVCLWNISQVAGAHRVILPDDSNSLHVIAFTPPGSNMMLHCEGATVIEVAKGTEHKVGSASSSAWIAAQKGDAVILEYATSDDAAGDYPDGCRVEMYSNKGLGYTEIETLSAERNLKVGERMENTLHIECYPVSAGTSATEIAAKVRAWRGEVSAPK